MLSRVANSIYWMSRQVERAENMARFLEVTHKMILDQAEDSATSWYPLIQVTADTKRFASRYDSPTAANVRHFLALDREYHSSMISNLKLARENARSVREVLSTEMNESVNDFYQYVKSAADKPDDTPEDFLNRSRELAIHWTGVFESTMPRGLAWHFGNVGRLIERADKTSRILDVKYFQLLPNPEDVGTAVDDLQWVALLSACDAVHTYRQLHHRIRIPHVIDLFLFRGIFPRSVLFCVEGVVQSLQCICQSAPSDRSSVALDTANRLLTTLQQSNAQKVIAEGMHAFVDQIQTELNDIGIALEEDYFAHPSTETLSQVG